jgi:hypothetical protein
MQTHTLPLYSNPSVLSGRLRQMIDGEGEVSRAVKDVGIGVGGDDDVLDSPGLAGRVGVEE